MQRKHIKQIFWIALSNILDVHKTINLVILFEIMADLPNWNPYCRLIDVQFLDLLKKKIIRLFSFLWLFIYLS